MQVSFLGSTYDCTKAVRQDNNATLYLTDGVPVIFVGIAPSDWDKFELNGGNWMELAIPTVNDRIAALESALTSLMIGGAVNTEFLRLQYLLGNLTQESVQSAVPRLLTNDQANTITGGIAK